MMKSYTLNNWDGNLVGSEETTPRTVSSSLTSAQVLTSNVQTSDSSNNVNFGKTVSHTLYGGEHGKEGIGTDNGSHDASTEGASMFDSWVNGEMYGSDDAPSSSKEPSGTKQDQNRTAPRIVESESSFENAPREFGNGTIAENHAYSQSSLLPRNTAGTIREVEFLETSSSMLDAPNNIDLWRASSSTAKDLSSDNLTFSTTIQISPKHVPITPNGLARSQKDLMFIPDLNSPLHTVNPSDLSRRSPIPLNLSQLNFLNIPMNSPMSSIYLKSGFPSPKSENPSSDAISVHTADGEGTDEDDEVIILENIPSNYAPKKPAQEDMHDSLFTPPPSDGYIAVEDLFTPPPAKRKRPRPPPKVLMSHVSLPPPRHQTNTTRISRPPPKKKPRPVAQVQVHNDLARAMQASWDNNDSLGTLPLNKTVIKVNRPKAKETKYQGNKHWVAGPSRHSSESTSVSKDVQQAKRRRNGFEEEGASISSKRARITIDLTLTDNSSNETKKRKREEVAKPKPMPKPKQVEPIVPIPSSAKTHAKVPPLALPHAEYNAGRDRVRLSLGTIRQTPPDLVFHNTRFIRRRVLGATPLEDTQKSLEGSTWSSSGKARTRKNVDIVWPSSRSRSKTTTSTIDSENEISVGGCLFCAEEVEGDDEDGSAEDEDEDDDVVIVSGPLRPGAASKPSAPLAPPPPKIDLAAQFKKRQRKPQVPTPKRVSTTVNVASSPSVASVRPTRTQIHTATPSISASSDITGLVPTPSAKALGKRRAVSPTMPMTSTSARHPSPLDHPNSPLVNQPQGLNNYPNPYYQNLLDQPSFSASSSSTTVTYPQRPNFYAPIQHYDDLHSSTTSLGAHPPQRDSNVFSPGSFGAQAGGQSTSWATQAEAEHQEYTYPTINPMWLGGPSTVGAYQEPEPDLELSHSDIFQIPSSPAQQEPDFELPANTHSDKFRIPHSAAQLSNEIEVQPESQNDLFPIPPSPSFLNAQDEEYEPSTTVFQSLPDAEGPRLTDDSRSPSMSVFKLPPRRGRTTTSEYASSAQSSDDDDDDSKHEVFFLNKRKLRPVASTSQTSIQNEPAQTSTPIFLALSRTDQAELPRANFEEWCHQCRRKTFYFKMSCRCGTLICCRCIASRYPDKVFNIKIKQQTCPRCENYCNCTQCCSKRNVPYISSARAVPNTKTKTKMKPSPPFVLPSTVPPPNARYWGAIYSLDGQKMGATFAAPAEDGLPSVVFAGSLAQPLPAKRLKRAFIGRVQRSWGFGRDRLIKELNPVPQNKSKSRKNGHRVTRSFVGSAAFLRYRLRLSTPDPPDEQDLLDGLSPLTLLSDSEDDNDEAQLGVSISAPPEEAFTPGCLEERDVARAIAASFEALGIPTVVELPYYY